MRKWISTSFVVVVDFVGTNYKGHRLFYFPLCNVFHLHVHILHGTTSTGNTEATQRARENKQFCECVKRKTGMNICFQFFDNRQNGITFLSFSYRSLLFRFLHDFVRWWCFFSSLFVRSNLIHVQRIVGTTIHVQPVCCNFNCWTALSFSSFVQFHHCLTGTIQIMGIIHIGEWRVRSTTPVRKQNESFNIELVNCWWRKQ